MDNVAFLIFRRMRAPLIVLIAIYAVGVMGLVLIPGQDAEGNLWHMDFFHAFYFFSYTATTIGFGEIPYAFSDAQRLWVTLGIYLSVVAWFYSIGTLIALLQDKTFQNSLAELRFARRIRRMREPFYLVCGYGETAGAPAQPPPPREPPPPGPPPSPAAPGGGGGPSIGSAARGSPAGPGCMPPRGVTAMPWSSTCARNGWICCSSKICGSMSPPCAVTPVVPAICWRRVSSTPSAPPWWR